MGRGGAAEFVCRCQSIPSTGMTMHNLLLLVNFSKMVRVYKKKSKRAEYGSAVLPTWPL